MVTLISLCEASRSGLAAGGAASSNEPPRSARTGAIRSITVLPPQMFRSLELFPRQRRLTHLPIRQAQLIAQRRVERPQRDGPPQGLDRLPGLTGRRVDLGAQLENVGVLRRGLFRQVEHG